MFRHSRLTISRTLLPLIAVFAAVAAACASEPPAATPTPEPTSEPTATPTPTPEPTTRVVLLQGVCSSTALHDVRSNWTSIVREILVDDYGLVDLPTGDPDDQVIEFGYAAAGWDTEYLPTDTLTRVGESSAGLRDIYAFYPDSKFFLLGHSLGGVVALDGLARHSNSENRMAEKTGGAITVSSSVRGIEDDAAGLAGTAIELVACQQLPQSGASSPVWDDISRSGDAITTIHGHDWSGVRVVNFGNARDRVVDLETAILDSHFEVSCFDEGSLRLLRLNHDTLLIQRDLARELLGVLIDGEPPSRGCT